MKFKHLKPFNYFYIVLCACGFVACGSTEKTMEGDAGQTDGADSALAADAADVSTPDAPASPEDASSPHDGTDADAPECGLPVDGECPEGCDSVIGMEIDFEAGCEVGPINMWCYVPDPDLVGLNIGIVFFNDETGQYAHLPSTPGNYFWMNPACPWEEVRERPGPIPREPCSE